MPTSAQLVAIAALAACGRSHFSPLTDGAQTGDGSEVDVPSDAPLGPWGALQPLTQLNSGVDDTDPELRADGLELIFHSLRPGIGLYDLYQSVRATTADPFGAPVPLTSLNTAGNEQGPGLSADGRTLYFSDGNDIVFATRTDLASPFGPAQPLPELSSADVDTAPEVSGDGLIAIITRGTSSAREMWGYTRAVDGPPNAGWGAGVQLTELSSPVTETSPDLDLHGRVVYFHSDRDGTTDDIFMATRASPTAPFGAPTKVNELSTAQDEGDPTLSADSRILVMHVMLDLYIATR